MQCLTDHSVDPMTHSRWPTLCGVLVVGFALGFSTSALEWHVPSRIVSTTAPSSSTPTATSLPHYRVFIAMPLRASGSFPNTVRATWLRNASERVGYRFYTDDSPSAADRAQLAAFATVNANATYGDIVGLPVSQASDHLAHAAERLDGTMLVASSGGNAFNHRMLAHALSIATFDYYLRLDVDGYLCVDALVDELDTARPRSLYAAGSFHCAWGTRIDESFLLLSSDLARFFATYLGTVLRDYDPREIFDVNLGYYLLLTHARLLDDKRRVMTFPTYTANETMRHHLAPIIDSRISVDELASPAHAATLDEVCSKYLYVHPIKEEAKFRVVDERVRSRPRLELARNRPPIEGPLCAMIEYEGGPRRPGRLPVQRLPTRFSTFANASTSDLHYIQPTPYTPGSCCHATTHACVDRGAGFVMTSPYCSEYERMGYFFVAYADCSACATATREDSRRWLQIPAK